MLTNYRLCYITREDDVHISKCRIVFTDSNEFKNYTVDDFGEITTNDELRAFINSDTKNLDKNNIK